MKSIVAQCDACKGVGLVRYIDTPHGTGLICGHCKGSGSRIISYIPFTRRRKVKKIERVAWARERSGLVGANPEAGPTISYDEFLAGKMPESTFKTG